MISSTYITFLWIHVASKKVCRIWNGGLSTFSDSGHGSIGYMTIEYYTHIKISRSIHIISLPEYIHVIYLHIYCPYDIHIYIYTSHDIPIEMLDHPVVENPRYLGNQSQRQRQYLFSVPDDGRPMQALKRRTVKPFEINIHGAPVSCSC